MLVHPQIDPVAIHLGPIQIHWYGLMYLLAFIMALMLGRRRLHTMPGWTDKDMDDLVFYGVLGVIVGGRTGYVLFYNLHWYLTHPADILSVWHGGMSFHGGMLGVIIAMLLFARKKKTAFLAVTDFVAPLVPSGLAAGRIGNFINGELPGRVTDVPWAMIYPQTDHLPRHPSQLYEFALEGVVLFLLLWIYSSKKRPVGAVSGLFLTAYGCFRFFLEFFRQPDAQLGLLSLGLSMGQWLSLPMIVVGLSMLYWAYHRK